MFENLGRALGLIRELRGKSQAEVAREAGIGKGQLSKYESGKDLPKLESLKKVLAILSTGPFEFFYTMRLLDHGREKLDSRHDMAEQSFPTLVLSCSGVFSEEVDASFQRLLGEVLALCHHMLKDKLLSSARERKVDDRQGRLFP